MRIESLTLHGFKSFAKKSEVFFDEKITGIVGPNGSGKSNIVEAIRFVLGEQSMKSLRGGSSTDVIFKGNNDNTGSKRALVTIVFDNNDGDFSLETIPGFDKELTPATISIGREVDKSGGSTYYINNNEVRLKDVVSLISSVNIGSSGHHIISQGEADRLLSASNRERKTILEESLGLKVYHSRIKESERKIAKTRENLLVSKAARSELLPRLSFLKKHLEKIEQVRELKEQLKKFYEEYFSKKYTYLRSYQKFVRAETDKISKQKEELQKKVRETNKPMFKSTSKLQDQKNTFFEELATVRGKKEEVVRNTSKIEGFIEMLNRQHDSLSKDTDIAVSKSFLKEVSGLIKQSLKSIKDSKLEEANVSLLKVDEELSRLYDSTEDSRKENILNELSGYRDECEKAKSVIQKYNEELAHIQNEINAIEILEREEREQERKEQAELYAVKSELDVLERSLGFLERQTHTIERMKENLELEVRDGGALIQEDLSSLLVIDESLMAIGSHDEFEQKFQEISQSHRTMDRVIYKIEDVGSGGQMDVQSEHTELEERETFLANEIHDCEKSIESLMELIDSLKLELEDKFVSGLESINKVFDELFKTMFQGGHAKILTVLQESEGEGEETLAGTGAVLGIDIEISLPKKKIDNLGMLSGGERSLVSLILLIALSMVNPPPFLVLDETDAALDEANSRRYADMVEKFSHKTQLIMVTHNRETMSRAHVLFGVTIGNDGGSQLLSVRLEEAMQYAK